jgi:hypothetical protein
LDITDTTTYVVLDIALPFKVPLGMKAQKNERFRLRLAAFLTDVVVPMGRKERRDHAEE